jgi:hypothetical protein
MKRLLVIGVAALIYGMTLAGCGDDAGFEAVIIPMSAGGSVSGPPLTSFTINGPVMFKVQKSANDDTPVPGVEITLYVGSTNAGGVMFRDPAFLTLAGNGLVWNTNTDDQGVVQVFPVWTFGLCPGTEDLPGSASVTAVISADVEAFVMTTTLDCTP